MDYLGESNVITGPYKRETIDSVRKKIQEWKQRSERSEDATLLALEDEGRDHTPRNVGGLWKLEKEGSGFCPRASRRNAAQLTHFRLLIFRTVR